MTTFDAYVEGSKKERKLASDYINAVLRTALTRWHTSRDSSAECGAKLRVEILDFSKFVKTEIGFSFFINGKKKIT